MHDQRIGDVVGLQRVVRAPVSEEAAFAVWINERDEPAGLMLRVSGEPWGHADRLEPRRLTLHVGRAHPADEVDRDAEGGEPRRLIGRRAAGLERDRRAPVRAPRERPLRPYDDIGHHVANDEDAARGSLQGRGQRDSRRRGGAAGAYSRPSKSFMKLRSPA